ncbi:hypothetical protein VNI00_007579 [Paramarasmius palmivorus]|uniref:Uncharacterized protein n=1 Tax=Paramarasmius palmivorus TaxID=297713 RepID=A0AAW0D1T7_9AGAR
MSKIPVCTSHAQVQNSRVNHRNDDEAEVARMLIPDREPDVFADTDIDGYDADVEVSASDTDVDMSDCECSECQSDESDVSSSESSHSECSKSDCTDSECSGCRSDGDSESDIGTASDESDSAQTIRGACDSDSDCERFHFVDGELGGYHSVDSEDDEEAAKAKVVVRDTHVWPPTDPPTYQELHHFGPTRWDPKPPSMTNEKWQATLRHTHDLWWNWLYEVHQAEWRLEDAMRLPLPERDSGLPHAVAFWGDIETQC